jgi:nitroreductase
VDTVPADTLERLVAERFSCRGFLRRQIPPEVLSRLLEMAQRSPSWCNTQPWQLTVLEGAATDRLREDLVQHAAASAPVSDIPFPERYTGVHQDRRRECAWQLYEAVGVQRGDREASARQATENFRFFGAPNVAVLTTDAELGVYGAVDCGVYVAHFLLAAQSLGLGAIAQAALASHSDFLRERLGLPVDRKVVLGLSFGYPDHDHPANSFRTHRADPASVVTRLS